RSRVLPVAAPRLWPRRRTMPGLQNAYKEDRGRRTGHTLLPEMPEVGSPDPQEKLLQAFPVFRWSNWRFNISHKFYDSLQPSQELSICWFIRDEFATTFPRLVIATGILVFCTLSMRARQRALSSLAETFFIEPPSSGSQFSAANPF